MRSAVAGHSVDTKDDGKRLSRQVSQMSLRKTTFDLLSHADDGTFEFLSVDVVQYDADRRQLMQEALTTIESELRRKNREHRMAFSGVMFGSLLDKIGYPLEKVLVGAHDPGGPQFVLINVNVLQSAVESFRSELDRRGIGTGTYDGTERCLVEIEYVLTQLRAYYDGSRSGEVRSDRAAHIFASYAREMFGDLSDMPKKLDEEYERED